jgi:GTP-binding protein Era
VDRGRLAEHLLESGAPDRRRRRRPGLRLDGYQVDVLTDVLVGHLPPGPPLFPGDELTDSPEHILIAELVREAALEGAREELPHSLARW